MNAIQVTCSKCGTAVRVPGPGRYKCPRCGATLAAATAAPAASVDQQLSTPAYLQKPTASAQSASPKPRGAGGGLPGWVVPLAAGTISFIVFAVIAFVLVSMLVGDGEATETAQPAPPPVAAEAAEPEPKKRDPRMAVVPDHLATDMVRKVAFEISFMGGSRSPEALTQVDKAMQRSPGYVADSLELDSENNRIIFEYIGPELNARQYVDVLELNSKIETRREPIFLGSRIAE